MILILAVGLTGFWIITKTGQKQNNSESVKQKEIVVSEPSPTMETPSVTPAITSPKPTTPVNPSQKVSLKDTVPPKAYILSPANNSRVRTPVKIVANVTDNVKIDRVEFYAGSSDYQLIGTVYQPPYEVIWTPSKGFDGYGNQSNIPIYLKAYDSSGNYSSENGIAVYLDR